MKVFEPIKIGKMRLNNRMIVSAMVTNYCTPEGMATEKFIAYHEHKARGGWGLIITEDYVITPNAGGFVNLPGLWDDKQIESHQNLTKRIHAAGGKIAAQIYHAGRETTSSIIGEQPVAPSAIREPSMPEVPRALCVEEIHLLVEQFGDCALRVKKAGFDAVEIHGAHGYLIGAFASPFSNKRSDEYGGTIRNRARFAMEIIRNVKQKCGEDFPVIYRMSVDEYVPGGLEPEESKVLARYIEEAGADCIHCSQGVYASTHTIIPPSIVPRAAYVDNAAAIKGAVTVPVIAVGRINDVDIAESVLVSGKADMVTMARASLADPDLPNKVLNGRADEVIHCIGCLQGCTGENGKGNCVRCLVNPLTGMEDEYDLELDDDLKNVMVIGGGVSGCEAAITAAIKGHKVTLIEKSDSLGGQWIPASVPLGKSEFTSFIVWQKQMLKKLNVTVLLNTVVDQELVELYNPEAVILATGSTPFIPQFKGCDQAFVVTAHDVLMGKVQIGKRVVVIGGGLVGAETADMLSLQCKKVSIVEMLPEIMKDGEASPTKYMKERFKKFGVDIYTSTKLMEIGDHRVIAEKDGKKLVIDQVDQVIVAVGVKTNNDLRESIEKMNCRLIKVGDANGVKNGYLGIREGYEAGLNINRENENGRIY